MGANDPLTLYTQDGCAASSRVRACFLASAVPFVERNVSGNEGAAMALLATGVFATPVVVAGERSVVGGNVAALAEALGFTCRCPADDSARR